MLKREKRSHHTHDLRFPFQKKEEKNQIQYAHNNWNVKYEGKISVKTKEKQWNEELHLWEKSAKLDKNKAEETTAQNKNIYKKKKHNQWLLDTRKYCE